ncbi:UDP-N-acetylmuramoyl-tripeptide--D-alanyl-D-alanine ligase [Sediminibacillus albus]|uniref:UDP-N-acetylmuramoyl-tripeptide--D-alanyl-D-alanine ligase n=1 Tax=Sediminibacillus albus TaxID=407036 RepID=A0A1G8W7I2_9BACI|nr:UDP-N-acetylmuramoyl-tripeptide--D-alanyl-D-alanine ligase [Sediminibacillus albus]SDJ74239.1 UDP-N-acetylmuramoyl-tripeptide--D-alanyl-D-alanine ligase [Sediminibacillus albus]
MLFTTNFLGAVFKNSKGSVQDEIAIGEVTTDSRVKTHKSLFVPIAGENFDGHEFIKGAFDNGAVAALWTEDRPLPDFLPSDFPVFFVEDTLSALQKLAAEYLKQINPIVIGVTGSNGKTTTKDLIGSVVSSHYRTHRTKGNLNNHIGMPLTILSMERETEVLVLEMGMSGFGEIELLSKIAEPDYGVITNIGESHIEYLGSREGIAQAKAEIMAGMNTESTLFIDGDEPLLAPLKARANVIDCGFTEDNSVRAGKIKMKSDKTSFLLNGKEPYELNMLGEHNVKNALFAISIGKKLAIPEDKIKASLADLQLTGMRFEFVQGKNQSMVINDAYNASPTSMKASINVVKQMEPYQKKILVLGDIFELGEDSKSLHREVADVITKEISVLFTIGQDAEEISKAVSRQGELEAVDHFESMDQLVTELKPYLQEGTLVLLKASRGMKFEKMLEHITN